MPLDERGFDVLPSPHQLSESRSARINEKALEWERRIRGAIAQKMERGENSVKLERAFKPHLGQRYSTNMQSFVQSDDDEREVHEELPTAVERALAWGIARNNAVDAVRAAGWRAELNQEMTLTWWPEGVSGT